MSDDRKRAEEFVIKFWKENGRTVFQYSMLVDMLLQWESAEQSTETPPKVEQLAVDLCRELYDRFMMGGWAPEDAHTETIARLKQWAEAPAQQFLRMRGP